MSYELSIDIFILHDISYDGYYSDQETNNKQLEINIKSWKLIFKYKKQTDKTKRRNIAKVNDHLIRCLSVTIWTSKNYVSDL